MKCIIAIFFTLGAAALAQRFEPVPNPGDPSRPDWLLVVESDPLNLRRIDSAFEAWHAGRVFVKSEYTQFYKRYRRAAERYAGADGLVRLPSAAEHAGEERRLLAERGIISKKSATGAAAGRWSFLGPKTTFSTGRDNERITWQTNIYCIDQSVSDPDILFAGGETGGIWRSSDRGRSWSQVSKQLLHGSVRPVKIDPTNPAVVYAGSDGRLVKSTDAGASWNEAYAEDGLWTHDMLVSAGDPRVLCAATNMGLLRSSDAGTTWVKVLATECWSVAAKPDDPRVVYTVRDSANASVFCRSTDGGASFTSAPPGWWKPGATQTVYGARITVSAAAPGRVYALVGASMPEPDLLHNYAGVFVSNDAGRSWVNTNPSNLVGEPYSVPAHTNLSAADGRAGLSQGFYDFAIIADPADANVLVAGGTSWWRSTDAGATWTALGGYAGGLPWAHPDMQWLCARSGELWICSDGGINYSTDFALTHEARMDGIGGSDFWGFDAGWNEDVFVGGRYHNGNTAFVEGYPDGRFLRLGGGEAATGYLNPDENRRAYFSDIGGYEIPKDPAAEPIPFSVGLWPNESYYHSEFSGMSFDPRCSGTVYIGHGNGVWRSDDAGASYKLLRRFSLKSDTDATVEHIAIPRSAPAVIYASLRSNTVWDGAIWRSDDAGETWAECAPIPGTSGGERRVLTMTAGGADGRELWVALRGGGANSKVFKTADGGATWTNLTTPRISQISPSYIIHQLGTAGGVYLGSTRGGMYYRNSSMADWEPYADGLPISLSTRILRPFYRDGKIRVGSDMGIWEAPFFEASKPGAQISVDRMRSACARDTFRFSDRSVLRHGGGTTWQWSFPGARFVDDAASRNPRVVYGSPGIYSVSLVVREGNEESAQTLKDFITVESGGCAPDTVPGYAIALGGNADPGLVEVPPLGLRTNRFTFSAWVKPEGIQPSFASIICGNAVEINVDGDNELHYYWPPNGRWWVGSGLRVPPGEWSHVALVATPDSITLYVNGRGWSSHHANDSVQFSSGMRLGNYNGWSSRYFKGRIEEACFYDRPLARDEIRERMRLTRNNTRHPSPLDSGLVAYYQFNEADGRANDRVATRHAQIVGSAARVPSTAPIGGGSSARRALRAAGTVDFPGTGFTATLPSGGMYADGDVVVSRIELQPDARPASSPGARCYWVADNYGSNTSFTPLDSLRFSGYGLVSPSEAADPRIYSLYTRGSNADGAVWGAKLDAADAATAGADGTVTFAAGNGVVRFGQYYVSKEGTPTDAERLDDAVPDRPRLYPTVLRTGQELNIVATADAALVFYLSNAAGQRVLVREIRGGGSISTTGLPAGTYPYLIEARGRLTRGVIVLR